MRQNSIRAVTFTLHISSPFHPGYIYDILLLSAGLFYTVKIQRSRTHNPVTLLMNNASETNQSRLNGHNFFLHHPNVWWHLTLVVVLSLMFCFLSNQAVNHYKYIYYVTLFEVGKHGVQTSIWDVTNQYLD